jgi:hypothetical protein
MRFQNRPELENVARERFKGPCEGQTDNQVSGEAHHWSADFLALKHCQAKPQKNLFFFLRIGETLTQSALNRRGF